MSITGKEPYLMTGFMVSKVFAASSVNELNYIGSLVPADSAVNCFMRETS